LPSIETKTWMPGTMPGMTNGGESLGLRFKNFSNRNGHAFAFPRRSSPELC
jgi:hypothetical protein